MSAKELPTLAQWPKGWRNVPLWALFDRIKDVGHPNEEMLSVYRAHGVVRKSSLHNNNQTAENREIYQLIGEGWFIVNRMKAWQGSVGISPLRGIISGHYICFRPTHDEDPRFLNWLLRSDVYALEYARMSRGVRPGQIEIDNDELRGLRIALPPLDEQRRIADFLDAEASHVGRLREARDRQLTALEELALSRISAIVPDRSAIPFVRLGYLAVIQSGITVDGNRDSGEEAVTVPYLRVANVQDDHVDLGSISEITVSRSAAQSATLKYGDVLMTEGGDCLHQNHVFAVRPDQRKLVPEYLALITRTSYARSYFESTGTKTTNLASTSTSKIRDFRVPLLDVTDQADIFRDTDSWLKDLSKLKAALSQQLSLLTERRQALITAAATGQIDVATAGGLARAGGAV